MVANHPSRVRTIPFPSVLDQRTPERGRTKRTRDRGKQMIIVASAGVANYRIVEAMGVVSGTSFTVAL